MWEKLLKQKWGLCEWFFLPIKNPASTAMIPQKALTVMKLFEKTCLLNSSSSPRTPGHVHNQLNGGGDVKGSFTNSYLICQSDPLPFHPGLSLHSPLSSLQSTVPFTPHSEVCSPKYPSLHTLQLSVHSPFHSTLRSQQSTFGFCLFDGNALLPFQKCPPISLDKMPLFKCPFWKCILNKSNL